MKSKTTEDRRLIDEHSLIISPLLATLFGLNEAIILQQIHYWLEIANKKGSNINDGYHWTFNSIPQWQQQFNFYHQSTVYRTLKRLTECGLLITGRYNKMKRDRTYWYRIDYNALAFAMLAISFCRLWQNEQMLSLKDEAIHACSLLSPLPDTNPDTSLPDIKKKKGESKIPAVTITYEEFKTTLTNEDHYYAAIEYFMDRHKAHRGQKAHPKLHLETWNEILSSIYYVVDDCYDQFIDISFEDFKMMTDHYFTKKYKNDCDYCIAHFDNQEIKKVNYYEVVYNN